MKKTILLAVFSIAFMHFTSAQTFFSDDFSDLDISDWTSYDVDNDGNSWFAANMSQGSTDIPEFDAALASRSWLPPFNSLNPNNYVVSPPIDLTNANAQVQLEYAYGTTESSPYHQEQYSIYITTSNNLADIQAATAVYNETLTIPGSRQTNVVNLSAYVGQTIYITFRHHNSPDNNMIIIDDVLVRIPDNIDAEVQGVNLNRFSLTSVDNQLSVDIYNNGSTPITSVEVNWNDGISDHISTFNTNITSGNVETFDHPIMVNFNNVDENNITVTINNVNGVPDQDTSNNSMSTILSTLSQAGTKGVLIEESTGTWCGFCPRGIVALDYLSSTYPDTAITVAVHNGDPMADSEYDTALVNLIGAGWPNSGIDRTLNGLNPAQSNLETGYNIQITQMVPLDLTVDAVQVGNDITINTNALFYTNFSSANYRLGAIITEDGVTGTGSGYDHVNYYANNALGEMGGFEFLPDPVPASQMVYDHVGRALLGGFNGESGSVPTTITNGVPISHTFNYTIPSTSNIDNMHIVVLLIDQNDGSIVSAKQSSINQALSVEDVSEISSIKVYPNPAKDNINIAFLTGNGNYSISVVDILGRSVINTSVKGVFGSENIQLPISQLKEGHYILNINDGNATYSSKFIVSK